MVAALARRTRFAGALLAVGVALAPALAHDSWLLPGASTLAAPGSVGLTFITSEEFPKRDAATDPARVHSWVIVRDGVTSDVERITPTEASLDATLSAPARGLYVAAIALKPRFIEMDGPTFQRYLEDERASAALSVRQASGAQHAPGREIYVKYSKTFVEVGAPPARATGDAGAPLGRGPKGRPGTGAKARDIAAGAPVGHALEIIPLSNPCAWRVGERISVRALMDGQPAPGVFISSGREGTGHLYESTIRTDAKGEASFTFSRPGLWFLRTHTIMPLKDVPAEAQGIPKGKAPEWASFFASMTFRVGG